MTERDRRRWRRAARPSVTASALAALFIGLTMRLFIVPPSPTVPTADAVVVLAGASERLMLGRELVAGGVSDTLVVSNPDDGDGADPCPEASVGKVTCFRPTTPTTAGEAEALRALARR